MRKLLAVLILMCAACSKPAFKLESLAVAPAPIVNGTNCITAGTGFTLLTLAACNGAASQNWTTVAATTGYVYLKNSASGLVMDMQGGSTAAGAKVQQYTQATSTAEYFAITGTSIKQHSGLCLQASGTGIVQQTCSTAASQVWTFGAVPAPSAPVVVAISPTTATVASAGTQQFTATVTGSTNTSVTCNDAGNKCGLTTVTGAGGTTVTFNINGGTATGSVALTGTNAIANGTAITVVGGGAGYNSTGGAAVGTVTGGTASSTGAIALTTTLGAAASGPDTVYMLCSGTTSLETCYATATAPASSVFNRIRIRNITTAKIGMTLYDNAGAVLTAEKTFCTSLCDVLIAPPTVNTLVPSAIQTTASTQVGLVFDAFKMKFRGMSR